ncbi:beta-lactamase/transpeptidase-like protein [Gymnopus androsaceus JB14]|uniref:Beta-lactamase/transpeptidase-like protein n=1 Tax=Gymnopus androsaceus JB14 TaxID=1447944 RepID=A0A6A4H9C0_9AGAR|nr:beta-lactamase/transpeptidase-like protein [Gymnopus androsaceus JB14]
MSDPIASSESTVIDLMSHRTGLPRHDGLYYPCGSSLISKMKYLKPSAGFRETWQYSNIMYNILSLIPEVLLKTRFTRYVKEHIFVPLNLNSTTYSPDVALESGNLASGFVRDGVNKTEDLFGMGTPREVPFWPSSGGEDGNSEKEFRKSNHASNSFCLAVVSGAGGVISSAKDVATWLQTLLLEGKNPANNEQVIPSAVIHKVATGVTVSVGTAPYPELAPVVYGGGQMISSYRGHNFIEHGGVTLGFRTQITRFPFDNLGVAVLSNDDSFGSFLMDAIKWRIVDKLIGLDMVDWNSRYRTKVQEAHEQEIQSSVPRPVNPTPPSVSFSSLEGKYHNAAYGTLHLCGVPPIGSSSSSCRDLINELPIRFPGAVNASVPTFFTRLPESELELTLTHMRFQHFSGNLFNVSFFASLPLVDSESFRLNGAEIAKYWVYPPSPDTSIVIEFTQSSDENTIVGFGFTGDFWGAGAGVEAPVGQTVKERAEVWYDRI